MLKSKVQSLLSVSSSTVELDSFVVLALSFKVLSRLDHVLFACLQTHSHDFLIKGVLLGKSDRMMKPLGL